ncbi:MAG TPA: DUF6159 family protein [Usitatibacter sp.]|nr:DUF6159 family protein [Usitatibacter sp.]
MFERFSRSWSLVRASASVLAKDKELLVFPLISSAALLLVLAGFALPVIGLGGLDGISGRQEDLPPMAYVVAFLFYFCQYFVIFFFNAALVGAVMIRLDGGDPTVKDGLRIASSKVAVIAGYAFIAATVGMLLRVIQERVGFIGKIVVSLIGFGWTLATYLVVPVLVHRDVGPWEAVRESAALLRETWGENVIGRAGIGLAFGIIFFFVMVAGGFVIIVALMSGSAWLIALAFLATILALGVTALVQAALGGIYAAALYRYAADGSGSLGFEPETLKLAFGPAKK